VLDRFFLSLRRPVCGLDLLGQNIAGPKANSGKRIPRSCRATSHVSKAVEYTEMTKKTVRAPFFVIFGHSAAHRLIARVPNLPYNGLLKTFSSSRI
jgi:hypothetical protein